MDASNLRNFKDFLQVYNQMTEQCFHKCVTSINSRSLDTEEQDCIERCSTKFIKSGNKLMAIFVEVQSELMIKRAQEAEQSAQQTVQTAS